MILFIVNEFKKDAKSNLLTNNSVYVQIEIIEYNILKVIYF